MNRTSVAAVVAVCGMAAACALGQEGVKAGADGRALGAARQPARSAREAPVSLGDNAALGYYSVWLSISQEDARTFSELCGTQEWGKALPGALTDALVREQPNIQRLIRTAAMNRCDFGRDFSEGYEMLLPELAKMRANARLLVADADRCIVEGKVDEAAERYAAVFGLARHCGQDRLLISGLVSIAITNFMENDLVKNHGAAVLNKGGRAKVLSAIERMNGAEGFGLRRSIEGEQLSSSATLAKFDGPDAGRRFVDRFLAMFGGQPEEQTEYARKAIDELRAMDGGALRREGERLKGYYAEAARAWDAPDADARLRALSKGAQEGEYGPLGAHLLPVLGKCRSSQENGKAVLKRIADALRQADRDEAEDAKRGGGGGSGRGGGRGGASKP